VVGKFFDAPILHEQIASQPFDLVGGKHVQRYVPRRLNSPNMEAEFVKDVVSHGGPFFSSIGELRDCPSIGTTVHQA
jgi:hypothetical protein